ncbi:MULTISPECIES: head completion/stabilization protein [unclassified Acinetobacter]|uniref:head completion/stabilization protein n=1 Tax=unclassified Acinetobacter TaxID=196816 RepID=UPI00190E1E80|nr:MULTISPECIES: head completion/stabilization protein [unclassified Acinetobacter]MBK0062627.1 head completion/stabilization protein [Acinetobacter sp. S55]MBK0065796.1 head completion/stabilization protein [Acinetobacter sp. S54]
MSFVASGNTTPSHITINSTEFFPSISLDEIRDIVRIDGAVTDARLKQATLEEIIDVNRLLIGLVSTASSLAELATTHVDGTSDTEILYFSAVSNGVAAKVNEKYRSYDTSATGNKNADELTPTIDEYRRNKHWAIKQLLGESHTTVELI